MVREHYVPQSYLRLFAPEGEGVISRYSLVEKHAGGDYRPPKGRYSVRKAAAAEGFADEILEDDETTRAEGVMVEALEKIIEGGEFTEQDIAHLSQFMAFQHGRTPNSKFHFDAIEKIHSRHNSSMDDHWLNMLSHGADRGHETFQYMGWRVIENETDIPFFTSDEPVVHYFDERPEDDGWMDYALAGREIYCPVGPKHLLMFLDPEQFQIEPQFPSQEITRTTITDSREIWKFNLLQGINAFQEVFGPVDTGNLLEEMIEVLCRAFPDEDYIRGNRGAFETIEKIHHIAVGGPETWQERNWYAETGKPILRAHGKAAKSIWNFNHQIALVERLRRGEPVEGHWSDIVSSPDHPA